MVRPRPMTAMVRVAADPMEQIAVLHLARGHAAGQIVVQVEQGGGALLVRGQMQGSLSVFKEDVGVVVGLVEVQKAQGKTILRRLRGLGGQAVRGGQAQAAGFLGQEDRHAGHQQGARQPLDDGFQQGLQDRSPN